MEQGSKTKKTLKMLLGATTAFSILTLTSHPRSRVHKKIPKVKVKNVSLLPSFKIARKEKIYHIHHWLYLSSLYVVLRRKKLLGKKTFLHGLLLGSIIQGLAYKDRFKVVHRTQSKMLQEDYPTLPKTND